MEDSGPLYGEKAVVTGAGSGIGEVIVRRLVQSGAAVTLMGRNEGRLHAVAQSVRTDARGMVSTATLDVTKPASVEEAFTRAGEKMGSPSILVNSAGVVETAPFVRTTIDQWDEMIAVNLTGVFLTCRRVLPDMMKTGHGRIVNIASTAGVKGYRYVSSYTAAKHGVIGLTRSLALETADRGVTVNAVCPGYTETQLIADSAWKVAERTGRSYEQVLQEFLSVNPQGKFVQPDAVAHTVVWLCLPEQGSITGQAIVIDGGETA